MPDVESRTKGSFKPGCYTKDKVRRNKDSRMRGSGAEPERENGRMDRDTPGTIKGWNDEIFEENLLEANRNNTNNLFESRVLSIG